MSTKPSTLASAEALPIHTLITPIEAGIASRVLGKASGETIALFAFDVCQELSGTAVRATPRTIVRMPANVPHAVHAHEASRMLLIMIRDVKAS